MMRPRPPGAGGGRAPRPVPPPRPQARIPMRTLFFSRTSPPGTLLLRCVPNPTEPRP